MKLERIEDLISNVVIIYEIIVIISLIISIITSFILPSNEIVSTILFVMIVICPGLIFLDLVIIYKLSKRELIENGN